MTLAAKHPSVSRDSPRYICSLPAMFRKTVFFHRSLSSPSDSMLVPPVMGWGLVIVATPEIGEARLLTAPAGRLASGPAWTAWTGMLTLVSPILRNPVVRVWRRSEEHTSELQSRENLV